jgi:hypothetical protein
LIVLSFFRVVRSYALLLREVIRYTDADRADHAQLTTALAKIEAVATKVNEAKRLADQSSRAATIRVTNKGGDQAAVHAMLFQRDRHLLREAPMIVRVARFMRGTVEKEWTFFLYNDLLVWASTKSNTFKGAHFWCRIF